MMSRLRHLKPWAPFLVATIILGFCLLPAGRQPTGDAPHLLGISNRLAHEFTTFQWGDFAGHLNSLIAPHPPIGYLLPVLVYGFGFGTLTPFVCGLTALALIWKGLRLLAEDEEIELPWISLLVLLCCPLFWLAFSELYWDLLAASAIAMCLGHLAMSKALTNRHHSIRFGVWMGVGFLTKYTFPAFAVFPALLAGIAVVRNKAYKLLGFSLLAFLLVAGPWLLPHLTEVLPYVFDSLDSQSTMVDKASIAPAEPAYYLIVLKDAMGWPGLLVLSISLWSIRTKTGQIALAGAIGGLLVLSWMGQQEPRYLLPALPLLCYGVACSISQWQKRTQYICWGILIAICGPMLSFSAGANQLTRQQVPAERRHDHPRSTLSEWGQWPRIHASFLPVSSHPDLYQIGPALEYLHKHKTPEDGNTVGLLLDLQGSAGEMKDGLFFQRSAELGFYWDFVSLAPPQGKGRVFGKFKGPFRSKNEAHSQFRLIYTATKAQDKERNNWLDQRQAIELQRIDLPNKLVGRIVRLPAWESTAMDEDVKP